MLVGWSSDITVKADDSGQRWFKLAQHFQRRRSFYKSIRTTDGRRTPSEGKSSQDSLGQVS
jgi:hypothetical protein